MKRDAVTQQSDSGGAAGKQNKRGIRRQYLGVGILLGILLVLCWGILSVPQLLASSQNLSVSPEIIYTLWLVLGALALLGVLMIVALVANLVVGNRAVPGPLGLPGGSIRAVLALMLLLIFASSTVFLFTQIRAGEGDGFVSSGLSVEALRGLPQDRILEVVVENQQESNPANRTYRVRLAAAHADSIEFGKTAALTIGTLMIAVSGFYFGERATEAAIGARGGNQQQSAGGANGTQKPK